jgi:hypothetical protein
MLPDFKKAMSNFNEEVGFGLVRCIGPYKVLDIFWNRRLNNPSRQSLHEHEKLPAVLKTAKLNDGEPVFRKHDWIGVR